MRYMKILLHRMEARNVLYYTAGIQPFVFHTLSSVSSGQKPPALIYVNSGNRCFTLVNGPELYIEYFFSFFLGAMLKMRFCSDLTNKNSMGEKVGKM